MPKLLFWGAILALLVASAAAQDDAAVTATAANVKLVEPGDYPVNGELTERRSAAVCRAVGDWF
jgi:hypothetical protein